MFLRGLGSHSFGHKTLRKNTGTLDKTTPSHEHHSPISKIMPTPASTHLSAGALVRSCAANTKQGRRVGTQQVGHMQMFLSAFSEAIPQLTCNGRFVVMWHCSMRRGTTAGGCQTLPVDKHACRELRQAFSKVFNLLYHRTSTTLPDISNEGWNA